MVGPALTSAIRGFEATALLAQAGRRNSTDLSTVMIWSAGLILALVVGLWVALRMKRRLQQPDEPTAGAGFTLSDLRQLHRRGQMTDEEFERAKAKVVAAAQRATERDKAAAAARPAGAPGFPVIEAKPPAEGLGQTGDDDEDDAEEDEAGPSGR